jgi:NADPH:quinone reductase-like Zn-dependent oxidoreductase
LAPTRLPLVPPKTLSSQKSLGADRVVEYEKTAFKEVVKDVDLMLDTGRRQTLERSWGALHPGGTLISIVEEPSQDRAQRSGIRASFFIVEPNREHLIELPNLVDAGSLWPIVSEIFPLPAAREAYEMSAPGHLRGKIVLRVI